jgi:hypothetical protein
LGFTSEYPAFNKGDGKAAWLQGGENEEICGSEMTEKQLAYMLF